MKHLFVPYELALKLKEKGFDEPCLSHWERGDGDKEEAGKNEKWGLYTSGNWLRQSELMKPYFDERGNLCGEFSAPLYQQVIDWFREKHSLLIILEPCIAGNMVEYEWDFSIQGIGLKGKKLPQSLDATNGYLRSKEDGMEHYEALNKAIEEALKLI